MSKESTIVLTSYGPVRGRKRKNVNNVNYYSFQGIPYAKPPIGELRFKDPQQPEKWTEPLDATEQGEFAYALDFLSNTMQSNCNEDCLFLNIFTRNIKPLKKHPVMIWIHGGGFVLGNADEMFYGQDFLIEKEIILVTINYRIGAFGFLSIDDPSLNTPGNAGLKDQTLAIKWVAENCGNFGGDPNNITIFGESAGGASVHYHLLSDFSKGLFHKAIIQSGSALNPWANRPKTDLNKRLALKLGWNGVGGEKALFNVLMAANPVDISNCQTCLSEKEKQDGRLFAFVPMIEPYDSGSCFLPKNPTEMYKTGWGLNIPIIIGGTSAEGYCLISEYKKNPKMFDDDGYFDNAVPRELSVTADERKKLGAKLREFYYGTEKPTVENLDIYASLLSEKLFWHGLNAAIRARIENVTSAPTYLYRFSFNSKILNALKLFMVGKQVEGAVHGEDLMYLFNLNLVCSDVSPDTVEARIRNIFLNAWEAFATTGNPNYKDIEKYNWQPLEYSVKPFKAFNIDEECSVGVLAETERLALWDSIYNF